MTYDLFLTALFDDGHLRLPQIDQLAAEEIAAGDVVLRDFERLYRTELPGDAPVFSLNAGRWAGMRFYRACQFVVHRDVSPDVIRQELADVCPEPGSSEVHYSVDVVFRHLPDLLKFATSAAENDPLVEHLRHWTRQWPLSSVGVPDVSDITIYEIASNAGLLRLYVDRIIATRDASRLNDCAVRDAVQSALGLYPDLAPELSVLLRDDDMKELTDE